MSDQRALRRRIDALERLQALRVEMVERQKRQLDECVERNQRELNNLRQQLTIGVAR